MATRYNYTGQLITDGLVLNLDAAKRDSYPGSGTTWYDLSGNGNNGTLTNGPTYTGVSKDAAIVFDGVDDRGFVDTPFEENSNITVVVTFKGQEGAGAALGLGYLLHTNGSSGDDKNVGNSYLFVGSTGTVPGVDPNIYNKYVASLNGAWVSMATDVPTGTDQIYQICLTWDGNIQTSYINASQKVSQPLTGSIQSYRAITGIGDAYSSTFRPWDGNIYSTQVYNRALSQFEIFQNFNAMKGRYGIPNIVTDGLVLNLDAGNPYSYLSGSSGTTWTDVSGNGNNGTLTNGASYENGAMVFDGVDDYVELGTIDSSNPLSLYNTDFTVSFWFKPEGIGDIYQRIIDKSDGPSMANGWGVVVTAGTDLSKQLSFLINGSQIIINNDFNFGEVYNIVFTKQGTTFKMYNNTTLKTTEINSTSVPSTTTDCRIGAWPADTSRCYDGNIYNIKIYNRALSQTEITQNFNALRGRYGI